jgi:hypothetical protein
MHDELRALAPALDRAISGNHSTIELVERVRDVAIRYAEALRLALKHSAERERGHMPAAYFGRLFEEASPDGPALVVFYRPDRGPFGRRFSTVCGSRHHLVRHNRIGGGSATSNPHTTFGRTEARNR